MGIAKSQFNNILGGIFKTGNTIKLFSTVPDEETEAGGVVVPGSQAYTIQDGDFTVGDGVVTSRKNMLMYLCETDGGHGIANGFGVYGDGGLLYFGRFTNPMDIKYNSVPTIKRYDSSKREGVQITMVSKEITEASASAE